MVCEMSPWAYVLSLVGTCGTNLKAVDPLGSKAMLTEMGHWVWAHGYG